MYLCKTDKAREELAARLRTLTQRERAAVLMADGTRTGTELRILLQCDDGLIERLTTGGYLQPVPAPSSASAPTSPRPVAMPLPAATAPKPKAPAPPPAGNRGSDNFDGKRSLATTRMFLFDISERMFARRHPDKAVLFRDQLREARDRDSMLMVSRDMITVIEQVAGHERADSLSERIAMLLPLQE